MPLANSGGQDFGTIDMTTALTNSVNTYWAQVGEQLGTETMVEYMERFGFYADPKLDYPDNQMRASGPYNSAGDLVTEGFDVGRVAIGQGGEEGQLLAAPLQMAQVAGAVANDGKLMKPTFLQEATDPDGRQIEELDPDEQSEVMSEETSAQVTEMMTNVANEGTAAGLTTSLGQLAGKTGYRGDRRRGEPQPPLVHRLRPGRGPADRRRRNARGVHRLLRRRGRGADRHAGDGRAGAAGAGEARAGGQKVGDRYTLIERIGSGGMADVWSADDSMLGREVALKFLHERFNQDEQFVERFRREAQAAAGLQHPNVVSVYDRGEHEGRHWIAMEYVQGASLKDLITRGLSINEAIEIVRQILAGAKFAHERGIVHRDMKPHNVLVDGEGRARVTDFGIARAGASEMTQTGSVLGTAQYLSPEQAQGFDVKPRPRTSTRSG